MRAREMILTYDLRASGSGKSAGRLLELAMIDAAQGWRVRSGLEVGPVKLVERLPVPGVRSVS